MLGSTSTQKVDTRTKLALIVLVCHCPSQVEARPPVCVGARFSLKHSGVTCSHKPGCSGCRARCPRVRTSRLRFSMLAQVCQSASNAPAAHPRRGCCCSHKKVRREPRGQRCPTEQPSGCSRKSGQGSCPACAHLCPPAGPRRRHRAQLGAAEVPALQRWCDGIRGVAEIKGCKLAWKLHEGQRKDDKSGENPRRARHVRCARAGSAGVVGSPTAVAAQPCRCSHGSIPPPTRTTTLPRRGTRCGASRRCVTRACCSSSTAPSRPSLSSPGQKCAPRHAAPRRVIVARVLMQQHVKQ